MWHSEYIVPTQHALVIILDSLASEGPLEMEVQEASQPRGSVSLAPSREGHRQPHDTTCIGDHIQIMDVEPF